MNRGAIWWAAKGLEGAGMIIVLVGVLLSMRLGFEDRSLESMEWELRGLLAGGGMFLVGYLIERRIGAR